uniref:U-box domain-containing protein n=1 Tax=Oryza barthii TaxID=65489 RepID=A0A0D3FVQ9_9ORYZ
MGEESSPAAAAAAAPAVEVPSYFVCPISLEIMRDPVTLSTGITYDRESIERWVFTDGHGECPVTKQRLAPADGREPTPNHTLRRLIQGWCAVHAVERFPTPRRCVQGAPGAVEFLLSVVKERASVGVDDATSAKPDEETTCGGVHDPAKASSPEEAALSILHSLKLFEESFNRVLEGSGGEDFLETMACVLRRPSYLSRMQGIHLLKSALPAMAPARLTSASAALVGASGERTRARAREMLKMHARVWRDSPCLASHLNASYPR